MILDADIAMYKAKEEGKGRYVIFRSTMKQALHDRLSLVNDLKEAVKTVRYGCIPTDYGPQIPGNGRR